MNGQLQSGPMQHHTGFRALGYFWLTIVMILAGGAGMLQYSYVPFEQGGRGHNDARGDIAGLDIMIAASNSAAPSPSPRVEPARKLRKTFLAAATASDETAELPKVQAEPDPAEDPSAGPDSAASPPEPVSEPDTVGNPAPIDEPAPVNSPAPVSEPAPVAEAVQGPAPPSQMPAPASSPESAETKTAPAAPIPSVSTPTVSTPAASPPDSAAEVRPAAPAPRAAAPPAVSSAGNPALAEAMIRRADALLQRGDVSAARLLYERAAAAGSGRAATAMGKTFDPAFLAGIGAVGLSADPTLASTWYQRALLLGDDEARVRLQSLGSAPSRAGISHEARP